MLVVRPVSFKAFCILFVSEGNSAIIIKEGFKTYNEAYEYMKELEHKD